MATEFAISRFVVPFLQTKGWALFMDCDMLCRADIAELFALRDPSKAVMVVKHKHKSGVDVKMDGQAQTYYRRKNWSSVVLWNCEHKAHHRLKYGDVLSLPGRDLHGFSWLKDDEIGSLPSHWNLLVGIEEGIGKIYHYTLGGPWFPNWAGGPLDHLWQFEKETYTKFHDIGRIQINGPLSEADAILLNPKKEYPPKSSGPSS